MEGTGDKDHLSRNKEKYIMLEEKTKELGYKVCTNTMCCEVSICSQCRFNSVLEGIWIFLCLLSMLLTYPLLVIITIVI